MNRVSSQSRDSYHQTKTNVNTIIAPSLFGLSVPSRFGSNPHLHSSGGLSGLINPTLLPLSGSLESLNFPSLLNPNPSVSSTTILSSSELLPSPFNPDLFPGFSEPDSIKLNSLSISESEENKIFTSLSSNSNALLKSQQWKEFVSGASKTRYSLGVHPLLSNSSSSSESDLTFIESIPNPSRSGGIGGGDRLLGLESNSGHRNSSSRSSSGGNDNRQYHHRGVPIQGSGLNELWTRLTQTWIWNPRNWSQWVYEWVMSVFGYDSVSDYDHEGNQELHV